MPTWRLDVPPTAADVVRRLPPEVKRAVKAALRAVAADPALGEALRGDLEGPRKFRVRRHRLVDAMDERARVVRVFGVGHRRGIHEEVAGRITGRPRPSWPPPRVV